MIYAFMSFNDFQLLLFSGDATIRTKYQIRTKVEFGPKKNSDLILKFGPEF